MLGSKVSMGVAVGVGVLVGVGVGVGVMVGVAVGVEVLVGVGVGVLVGVGVGVGVMVGVAVGVEVLVGVGVDVLEAEAGSPHKTLTPAPLPPPRLDSCVNHLLLKRSTLIWPIRFVLMPLFAVLYVTQVPLVLSSLTPPPHVPNHIFPSRS